MYHPPLLSLPFLPHTVSRHCTQHLASSEHWLQEVGEQIADGDYTLAPSLLVYYDDSLEPKVRELLEYSLRPWQDQSQTWKRGDTQRAAVRNAQVSALCNKMDP